MKKWSVIGVVLGVVLLGSVYAQANTKCEYSVMRGDANNDGLLDISDSIYLLFYLYAGGPAPLCTALGDSNGDGVVDLSDSVYLLNYIYSDGKPPGTIINDVWAEQLYVPDEVDNPPDIAFNDPEDGDNKFNGLPMTLELYDRSGEQDILSCIVSVFKKDGTWIGEIFDGVWDDGWENGLDMSDPIKIPVGYYDGVEPDGESYKLIASCQDKAGQNGEAAIEFTTKKEIEPTEQPPCRKKIDENGDSVDIDLCCMLPLVNFPASQGYPSYSGQYYQTFSACNTYMEWNEKKGDWEITCETPPTLENGLECGTTSMVIPGLSSSIPDMFDVDANGVRKTSHNWEALPKGSCDVCNSFNPPTEYKPAAIANDPACYEYDKDPYGLEPGGTNPGAVVPPDVSIPYNPTSAENSIDDSQVKLLSDEQPSMEPKTSDSPCYVKEITIYRNPEDYKNNKDNIKDDFDLENTYFTPESEQGTLPRAPDVNNNNNILLGPIEGWVEFDGKKSGGYYVGYGYLVDIKLEQGSDPKKCLKGQFLQTTFLQAGTLLKVPPKTVLINKGFKVGKTPRVQQGTYTHSFTTITKNSYRSFQTISTTGDTYLHRSPGLYIAYELIGGKWVPYSEDSMTRSELKDKKDAISTFCYAGSELWCSDDYEAEEKDKSISHTFLWWDWYFDLMKYVKSKYRTSSDNYVIPVGPGPVPGGPAIKTCSLTEPRIMWMDIPGYIESVSGIIMSGANKGSIRFPGFVEEQQNFIIVAQDSKERDDIMDKNSGKKYEYRWLCYLKDLKLTVSNNVNVDSQNAEDARRVKTTAPSCECIRQRSESGGLYEDYPEGGKHSC